MYHLALETSHTQASVALFAESNPLAVRRISGDTARGLVPALHEMLSEAKVPPRQIALVSTTLGPGSFTGLRLGVTTAKMLAYACEAAVLGLDTLELLARQALGDLPEEEALALAAIVDAQRGDVVAAEFQLTAAGQPDLVREPQLVPLEALLQKLAPATWLTGPALLRYGEQLPRQQRTVSETCWVPQADSLGKFAWGAYCAGRRDDLWQLAPKYYRRSAAEEKADRQL